MVLQHILLEAKDQIQFFPPLHQLEAVWVVVPHQTVEVGDRVVAAVGGFLQLQEAQEIHLAHLLLKVIMEEAHPVPVVVEVEVLVQQVQMELLQRQGMAVMELRLQSQAPL